MLEDETDVTRLLVVCNPVTAPVAPFTDVTGAVYVTAPVLPLNEVTADVKKPLSLVKSEVLVGILGKSEILDFVNDGMSSATNALKLGTPFAVLGAAST